MYSFYSVRVWVPFYRNKCEDKRQPGQRKQCAAELTVLLASTAGYKGDESARGEKSLSGFFPFPIHCWWKFILQGINIFTWCHLALPNSHGRSQVPYDSSNHGGLADRYERSALSACRSGMKGVLHISSSEIIGKLQSGKLAVCTINIEDRLCFAWLERNGWGEANWAAEWSPVTCDDELRVLHAFLHWRLNQPASLCGV